jgi:hypothetical protein
VCCSSRRPVCSAGQPRWRKHLQALRASGSAAQALCRSRNTPHPVRASLPSLLLCFCSASTVSFSQHPTPSACFTSLFTLVLLQREHCVVLATPHTQCVLHFLLYSCASAARALCCSRHTPHPVRASLPSLLLCFCSASTAAEL